MNPRSQDRGFFVYASFSLQGILDRLLERHGAAFSGVALPLDLSQVTRLALLPEPLAEAHMKDLQTQNRHGVNYLRYWVNEREGKVFCLVEVPDAEAANAVHREAHGLVADEIYEVSEGS